MEAVVFNKPQLKLRYEKAFPIPKLTNDTDVIVKVVYSGICGTDLHILEGAFPSSDKDLIMGHEITGVVHEAGTKSIFKKGQKVVVDPNNSCYLCDNCRMGKYQYCLIGGNFDSIGCWKHGGWARYVVVPQVQVYALPEGITMEQAAVCEPYSVVSHGFDRASPIYVGSKILISGAGIIGNLWVTTLHHHGHRDVTVSEMSQARLDIVKKLDTGYRLVTPDVLAKEKQLFDVIIDCTGVGKVMEINFHYLSMGGKYVVFGCCSPTHEAVIHPFQIYQKELTILGVKINPYSFPKAINWLKAMGSRYVEFEKLGVKTYNLTEYQQAVDDLRAGIIAKALFKVD